MQQFDHGDVHCCIVCKCENYKCLNRTTHSIFRKTNHIYMDQQKVKVKVAQSCLTLCDSMDCTSWNSPGQNTGVGSLSLLQGSSQPRDQTQGSNPGLLHCRQILYQLSHQGSPRILMGVAYPLSRGSSWPRNRTRASCIAGGFFPNCNIWATCVELTG